MTEERLVDYLMENFTSKELRELPVGSLQILIRSIRTMLNKGA